MSRHEGDKEKKTDQNRLTGYFPNEEYQKVKRIFDFIAEEKDWSLTKVFRYIINEYLKTPAGLEWVQRSLAQAPNAKNN